MFSRDTLAETQVETVADTLADMLADTLAEMLAESSSSFITERDFCMSDVMTDIAISEICRIHPL